MQLGDEAAIDPERISGKGFFSKTRQCFLRSGKRQYSLTDASVRLRETIISDAFNRLELFVVLESVVFLTPIKYKADLRLD